MMPMHDKKMDSKMKKPSMKDMASKMMKKADRFMDRVVETSTTDGHEYMKSLKK